MQKRKIDEMKEQIKSNGVITAPDNGVIIELNVTKGAMADISHLI